MSWWLKKAAELQQMGRSGAAGAPDQYTDEEARQAAVHSREDLVLVVSLLDTLIGQVIWIKWLLTAIGVLGVYLAVWGIRY